MLHKGAMLSLLEGIQSVAEVHTHGLLWWQHPRPATN